MSVQACLINGIGYTFPYKTYFLPHLDKDEEYELLNDIGLEVGYYELRNLKSDKKISPLKIIRDGMSGKYVKVLIVMSVTYLENTHGEYHWHNEYRNDEYVLKYAKERLERLVGKQEKEPTLMTFEYYQ